MDEKITGNFLAAVEKAREKVSQEMLRKEESVAAAYGLGYRDGLEESMEIFLQTLRDILERRK